MVTAAELGVLMAAVATPYGIDGEVSTERLADLVRGYVARGVEGIYCCGSSGEGLLLTSDERTQVVETAVEAAQGEIPVIAHVGALSTRDSIDLAHRAERAGATALSMIPPVYYNYGIEAILDHYRAVMDAVNLPMIVYNIPQFTGVEFTAESAGELLGDPRVIGIKHTAHSMFALERMRSAFPDKAYINGFDETFVAAMAAGARGTIGTTVGIQYELFAAARSLVDAGDLVGAQAVQSRINEVIAALVKIDVFPAAKYLSGRNAGGLGALGACRGPFRELSRSDRQALESLERAVAEAIREVEA